MKLSSRNIVQYVAALILVNLAIIPFATGAENNPLTPAGAARIDISPESPVPLMGYAARANLPAASRTAQTIYARALAIGSDADAAVLVTVDNCILPAAMTEEVQRRLKSKAGVPPERITLSVTHTHSAPCLTEAAPNIFGREFSPEEQRAIDDYTKVLTDKLENVALAALKDRKPAKLAWGKGNVGFAKNRRTPGGPVDHDLPVLRVTSPDGTLRALFVSYACHCTTLGGDVNEVHGDWAGVAAENLEKENPDAVSLIAVGCGADSNPAPRGSIELAIRHGEELAKEAKRLIATDLAALSGAPQCRAKNIALPFQPHFSRDEWQARAQKDGIVGFHAKKWLARLDRGEALPATLPYPVQTWTFGDQLALVFLGGEVVVDYSLRLKAELDAKRLWTNAYCNSVPCYIPSRRILSEGGYEAESSLWYYDRPQRLAPETEDLIVQTVRDLLPSSYTSRKADEPPPPCAPAEAVNTFRARPGFKVELVASEPLIESPVAIDFGADGRLWVCEMRDYPTGMDGKWKPGGRIKVLSDADNDGRYDTAEVWADDLPFPTGLMAWRNGVIVCAAPDVWLLTPEVASEKSGTRATHSSFVNVPARRQKLLSGFGTENYQARVNGLRWGLDGWIHGSGGLFGGKITVHKTGKTIDCTNRDFRFRPDTGEFEPLAGVSQQGHVRDSFDQWFGNDNSTLLWHFPMPDRYRRRNTHVPMPPARIAKSREAEPARVYPTSQTLSRFNHPESANRITSGCGPEIYRDELLGAEFKGNAFVCESVHNVVRRAVIEADGVTYSNRRAADEAASEFLASSDNWCRPVEMRTAPDGTLWMVDMYRYVIEHPRWIPPDRLAELDVRAGAERGRIWRILPNGVKPRPRIDFTKLSPAELAQTIESPNGPTRDIAHRLLLELSVERFKADALHVLENVAAESKSPGCRAQALAILRHRESLSDALLKSALGHPDARLRRFALTLAEPEKSERPTARPSDAVLRLINDPDITVRFQLALTLGEFGHDGAAKALAELAIKDGASEWHRAAILSSLLARPSAFVRHFAELDKGAKDVAQLRSGIASSLAAAPQTEALAHWITARFPSASAIEASRQSEALELLSALSAKPALVEQLEREATSPVAQSLKALRTALDEPSRKMITDSGVPIAIRKAALQLLANNARRNDERRTEFLGLLQADSMEKLRESFVQGLLRLDTPDVPTAILGHWSMRSPAQRAMLLPVLLSREPWTQELLSATDRKEVAPTEFTAAQRQQLRTHQTPAIRAHAEKLFAAATDRASAIQRFAKTAELRGDPARGLVHFDRLCATCHAFAGRGHAVGPELGYYAGKPVEDFLTAIIDPNAAIEPRYSMWKADMKDGRVVVGVVREESTASLVLVQPGGQSSTVARNEIARMEAMPVSLMPAGLEEAMTPQDMADLIAWMKATPAK